MALTVTPGAASAATPQLVKAFPSGQALPRGLVDIGGIRFFSAGPNDGQLWRSDGTEAGTEMVKDFSFGERNGYGPGDLVDVGETLFFKAGDAAHGVELWKSDGTEAGTKMVQDIYPGTANSSPYNLTDANGTLFFTASDETHGRELWRSDGTEAGTKMVKDIYPGTANSSPYNLTDANGTLFFTAANGAQNRGLWKSDGTEAGTELLKTMGHYVQVDANGTALASVGDAVFFSINVGVNTELWRSDGTEAGTVFVKLFEPPSGYAWTEESPYGLWLTGWGSSLLVRQAIGFEWVCCYFASNIWKSDGTEAGTTKLGDFYSVSKFTSAENEVYFSAIANQEADDTGNELWVSDGTAAGTELVDDIISGPGSSSPYDLTLADGSLYFFASVKETGGVGLWGLDTTNPPVAVDDSVTLNEDALATAVDVLANDTDIDGGPMEVTAKTNGTHGTVSITGEGTGLTYRPDPDYCGPDSFTYELNGGSEATVSVTVTCVDAPPAAAGDEATTAVEATTGNKEDFSSCVTKARMAFHKRRETAMQADGKTWITRMKWANRRKQKAVAKCRARFRKGQGERLRQQHRKRR